jgi:hypothetical protein
MSLYFRPLVCLIAMLTALSQLTRHTPKELQPVQMSWLANPDVRPKEMFRPRLCAFAGRRCEAGLRVVGCNTVARSLITRLVVPRRLGGTTFTRNETAS